VCGVAAVVAGVTYLSTGVVYPRSPVVTHHRDRSPEDVLSLGATGGVLRDGSTSDNDTGHHDDETPTQEAFIARYSELMDISPADQTIQYENGMTVTELDAYYHINDNGQQDGGGRAGATSALINDVQQDDRGGLNVAILHGSNVQEPTTDSSSSSSNNSKAGTPFRRRRNLVSKKNYQGPTQPPQTPDDDGNVSSVLGGDGGLPAMGATQEAFTARYPELLDRSPADQTVQYQAYVSYANGMTVDELDAYYHTHDNGQQEGGGGGAGAMNAFSCCKDNRMSSGCRTERRGSYCLDRTTPDQKYECEFAGSGIFRGVCCRTFPDNRVGSKFWVWEPCT